MPELIGVSAWDVDRTLGHGPYSVLAIGTLAEMGALPDDPRIAELANRNQPGSELSYISAVGKAYPWLTADISDTVMLEAAHATADRFIPTMYPEILPLFEESKEHTFTTLITDAPDVFAKVLGIRLHVNAVSGKLHSIPGQKANQAVTDKFTRLLRVCQRQGIHLVDFGDKKVNAQLVRAAGDAKADVPLLENVYDPKEAYMVNPMNEDLRALAKAKGWSIKDCASRLEYGDLAQSLIR